ncbi:hypothetical protein KR009_006060 [Drosophila setifemur]|nr:hypothetical protein KR009_006060 [Drosophila setifemur]
MEDLFGIANVYAIGLSAELQRRWSNLQNVLMSLSENPPPQNGPEVEMVPLPMVQAQEPDPALSAAGDGLHNNRPIVHNDPALGPALIIFRHRRSRSPWFTYERLLPVAIVLSGVLFKNLCNFYDIDINQRFVFGLSYNVHFMIFQCIMSLTPCWIREVFSSQM